MTQQPIYPDDGQPVSPPPEVYPVPQMVRVTLPDIAPYVTYTIISVTVVFYLLQLLSRFLFQGDIPAAGAVHRRAVPAHLRAGNRPVASQDVGL